MPLYLDTGDGGRKKIAAFSLRLNVVRSGVDGQWPTYVHGKDYVLRLELADDESAVDEQGSIRICQALSEMLANAASKLAE